jgi:Xaa-Pro aminopeptidase
MSDRIPQVREALQAHDADAVLLSSLPNIRWACGFTGSNARLIIRPHAAHFLTDGRYDTQAHREVRGADIHIVRGNLIDHAAEASFLADAPRVAFQSDHTTVQQREKLGASFEDVEWVPVAHLLDRRVASKDDGEVACIRKAQRITEAVFASIQEKIRPGVTERDLAAEIVYQHLRRGADDVAFDPIVASGPNAALPHARPTDRELQEGELIVIDMGAVADGYASDMTRTVALGDPGAAARRGYEVVREAQRAAIDAARAGMTTDALDAVARDAIETQGLGDAFSHSLGHGLGLEVHEWPRVSYATEDTLPEGTCVTIEPGVYVPAEGYGVRIEDIVRLHQDGCENLTQVSTELRLL